MDNASRRDMETALPGLRSMRVPGVLDRDKPEPGDTEEKVMVGIRSVRRRWAEFCELEDMDVAISPSPIL